MKEVTINFHTKTLGIFDVVQPVFEEDDIVFNSSMLKEFIEQMISAGKRNFAIDMSPLDDFSSGDNNALRELNKKVLGLNGTFTLFSPQPKVVGILQRMDIPSIIGVFNTEDELLALSEEIKSHQPPQSEFESLRSEIGNAFGETPLQTAAPAPAAVPAPAAPPQSFDAFEIEPIPPSAPPPAPPPPKAPAFGPPPPRTDAPAAPLPALHDFPESDPASPETQRFPEAPARSAAKAAPVEEEDDSIDFDDDEFAKPKKGLPVLPLAAVLAVIVLCIGGFFLFGMKKGGEEAAPAAAAPTPKPAEPAVEEKTAETPVKEDIPVTASVEISVAEPVPAAKTVTAPAAKTAPPPAAKAPAAKVAPAAKTAPPPAAKTAPAPAAKTAPPPAKAPAPAPVAAKTEPAPTPPPAPPPAQKNQIVITSNPSGAEVEIDGERKGVTPYTWNTPFFGDMVITVSKAGFAKASKSVDYSGGSQTHAFTLQTARTAPPPPAPAPTPAPAPAAAPPPPPAASGASIFIATLPSHADVYIGGRLIGKSNDAELQVPTGTHQVRFVKDGLEKTESMTFQAGKNPTRFVNLR
ncbi:MAG: PEGA domain-containing protein [Chitinispirillales bacterium]|nr:PEGA domain-containing protein [Chitinispirillales bacterium]